MSQNHKPREFWISEHGQWYDSFLKADEEQSQSPLTRVVDYDAYEQLQSEVAELKQSELEARQLYNEFVPELNEARTSLVKAQSELESVKAERDRYKKDFQNNYQWRIDQAAKIDVIQSQLTAEREASKRLVEIAKSISPHSETCGWDNNCECRNQILHSVLAEYKKARGEE